MDHLTRIKLDRDYVKSIIPTTKTLREMSELCGCSRDNNPETKTIQLDYVSKTDNQNHFIEYNLDGELLKWL